MIHTPSKATLMIFLQIKTLEQNWTARVYMTTKESSIFEITRSYPNSKNPKSGKYPNKSFTKSQHEEKRLNSVFLT